MNIQNEKNLAERLQDAEDAIKDAIQWLQDGGSLDGDVEDSAKNAIQTIVKLRRACD